MFNQECYQIKNRGCWKSVRHNQNLKTQRKRRQQRFLRGMSRTRKYSQGTRKCSTIVITPKNPLLPPFPLHFKVLAWFLFAFIRVNSRPMFFVYCAMPSTTADEGASVPSSPSQRAMTAVARQLPTTLIMVRAMSM